ncbi:exopolyphosphatase [Neptunicella marina]|uniref:Exopolyphosphatase n=1 Tax=Neptunicella marina TaxID=2125989 RepID=A0A8J6IRN0_9ALTE|nr:exopolyphosphatase [Neptunicella marina]MBC3766225.1 exopolyphosphatase [Neptunicella marina]
MPSPHTTFNDIDAREAVKVAALDLGSNSFHLVVARIVADSVQILHTIKQKVRLAEGLDDDNYLSEDAINRGLDTLSLMAQSLQGFHPEYVRIVATHTLRKAKNAKTFIKAARKIMPYPVEVIAGVEEARLIYAGVAHTNYQTGNQLVVDIGGGSTECIIGQGFDPILLRSVQMGCVSYTQKFFSNGEITPKQFKKAVTAAQQELELLDKKYRHTGWQSCIGTSGTIRTILDVASALADNPNKLTITLDDLQAIAEVCFKAERIEKIKLSGLSDDRQPVFVAGLAVLTAVFKSLKIDEMAYSTSALREGVIYEMEDSLQRVDIRQRTAESLATRYDVDIEQAKRVLATTLRLYDACHKAWGLKGAELKSMLSWAALLHEVGLQINSRAVQRHSAYIISEVELPGFNQEQQLLLALLVGLHRKKIRKSDLIELDQYDAEQVNKLICLLRLGVLLNIARQDDYLADFTIDAGKNSLQLTFPENWLEEQQPLLAADLARESDLIRPLELSLTVQ